MRKFVVMACLFAMTVSGCTSRHAAFVPPEANRAQLADAIARQGEPLQPGETIIEPPPPRQGRLEKMGRKALGYAVVAGACLGAVALLGLLMYAESRTHEPLGSGS